MPAVPRHLSMKTFREHLNAEDAAARARQVAQGKNPATHKHKNGKKHFKQLKRLYGDYLYFQDREKFDVDYAEWLAEQAPK